MKAPKPKYTYWIDDTSYTLWYDDVIIVYQRRGKDDNWYTRVEMFHHLCLMLPAFKAQ